MKPTGAGDLRDLVRFERRVPAADGYGNDQDGWATLVERCAAHLEPTRGGEQVIADRLQGQASFDLWVRSDAVTRQLTPDDRAVDLRDPSRVFAIAFVQDMDRKGRWLLLQLTLGGADG